MEISELRELVELDPEDTLLRYSLGKRLLEDEVEGDVGQAVENLEMVVASDPRHVATYLALGQAYLRQGREERARDVLEQGLEVCRTLQHGEGRDLEPEFEELLDTL
jgi:cytochrome c-type biogenesis protein CcmH/NrfG